MIQDLKKLDSANLGSGHKKLKNFRLEIFCESAIMFFHSAKAKCKQNAKLNGLTTFPQFFTAFAIHDHHLTCHLAI